MEDRNLGRARGDRYCLLGIQRRYWKVRSSRCSTLDINYIFDIPRFLAAEEKLVTSYKFGVYDLLVLPPSFPYGGMVMPSLSRVQSVYINLKTLGKRMSDFLDTEYVHHISHLDVQSLTLP